MLKKSEMDLRAKEDALEIVRLLIAAQLDLKVIQKTPVKIHDPVKNISQEVQIYYIQTPITGFYPEQTLEILRAAFHVSCGAFAEHLRAFLIRTGVGDPWKIISAAWKDTGASQQTATGMPAGEQITLSARTPEDLRRILIHIKMQLEQDLKQKAAG